MKIAELFSRVNDKFNLSAHEFDNACGSLLHERREWNDLESELLIAYMTANEETLHCAHTLLRDIYRVMSVVPPAGTATAESSTCLTQLRHILEAAFLKNLQSSVTPTKPDDIPSADFAQWLHDFVALHPVASHTAYTHYLAEEASLADIRFYLVQESAIDATTDDFLASLQIGAPGAAKMEIAANYWDEMGEGDHNLLHSSLFQDALRSFDIQANETDDALTLEALICGNLQTMLSLRREFFYFGVGYFAATEQLVPDRFKALQKGWERVGLSRKGADYHLLHIEVDGHHTERWYREVIAVLAQKSEAARMQMLVGALYRLHTSERYLTALKERFPSKEISCAA